MKRKHPSAVGGFFRRFLGMITRNFWLKLIALLFSILIYIALMPGSVTKESALQVFEKRLSELTASRPQPAATNKPPETVKSPNN